MSEEQEAYSSNQQKWVEYNSIRISDYIKVMRKPDVHETIGWCTVWVSNMNHYIGFIHEIVDINTNLGIKLQNPDGLTYWFPYQAFKSTPEKPIIISPKAIYTKMQKHWVEENNVKINETNVKVVYKAESNEDGWGAIWTSTMDKSLNKIFTVKKISYENEGIGVELINSIYYFPFFSLQITNEEPTNDNQDIESVRSN